MLDLHLFLNKYVAICVTGIAILILLFAMQYINNISQITPYNQNLNTNSANAAKSRNVFDDFESETYQLKDGQKSPNGKWKDEYNGYGAAGVKSTSDGNIFFMYPKKSVLENETHANLVRTLKKFKNFDLTLDMKTERQLRQNNIPKTWEAAWIWFRYSDDFHHYYFVLKSNGYELGKKDNDKSEDKQIFLVTQSSNSTKLQLGDWQNVRIKMVDQHIQVWLNRSKIIDFTDNNATKQLDSGNIGLYDEDALVAFDNVYIK